jgi:2-polyprenyl-3-methyl-5-hydroxy-6-metoxy-1,4-benzoquinol methylase
MQDLFYGATSSIRSKKVYLASVEAKVNTGNSDFRLGDNTSKILLEDPKLLGFMCARHKFVAKMLAGFPKVLEIGCQEGFGSAIVAESVKHLVAIDFYKPYIESCLERFQSKQSIEFRGFDMLEGPIRENFQGAFALDVMEHIDSRDEDRFMCNVAASLAPDGVFIIGSPSLESQKYASDSSRIGHINCKSGEALRGFCARYFRNIFLFGMNDEVLHTGYLKMSHYLIALCVGPKQRDRVASSSC